MLLRSLISTILLAACGGPEGPEEIAPLAVLDGTDVDATALALDANDMYVSATSSSAGSIRRVRKTDGDIAIVTQVPQPTLDVAVDEKRVYFTDASGGPFAIDKSGGDVQALGAPGSTWGIAVDESHVYFSVWPDEKTGLVFIEDKDGTNAHSLASDPGLPLRIVLDETNVYWGNQAGEVWSVPKAGGQAVKLASASSLADFVVLDDAFVYFTSGSSESNDGRVNRVAKTGGQVSVLYETGDYIHGLALLGDTVYAGTSDGIASISKDGSSSTLVEGTSSVGNDIEADAEAIYWISDSGGVYRLQR